jgi:hypothetical protein
VNDRKINISRLRFLKRHDVFRNGLHPRPDKCGLRYVWQDLRGRYERATPIRNSSTRREAQADSYSDRS